MMVAYYWDSDFYPLMYELLNHKKKKKVFSTV